MDTIQQACTHTYSGLAMINIFLEESLRIVGFIAFSRGYLDVS